MKTKSLYLLFVVMIGMLSYFIVQNRKVLSIKTSKNSEISNATEASSTDDSEEYAKTMAVVLNSKIDSLERDISELRNKKEPTLSNTEDKVRIEKNEFPMGEDLQKESVKEEQIKAFLDEKVSEIVLKGQRDSDVENTIAGRFHQPKLSRISLEDVLCSQQYCRAKMTSPNRYTADGLVNSLVDERVIEGEGFLMAPVENEDGTLTTVAYFARENGLLPSSRP